MEERAGGTVFKRCWEVSEGMQGEIANCGCNVSVNYSTNKDSVQFYKQGIL